MQLYFTFVCVYNAKNLIIYKMVWKFNKKNFCVVLIFGTPCMFTGTFRSLKKLVL